MAWSSGLSTRATILDIAGAKSESALLFSSSITSGRINNGAIELP
jgi:hypothetical protein